MASIATATARVFLVLLAVAPLASAVSFDFHRFDPDTKTACCASGKGVRLQGDAFLHRGLQLTKNQLDGPITSSAGRAVYSEPVHLWDAATSKAADFATRFSFLIHDVEPGKPGGDGLAFFLSPYPSLIPVNSSGGLLGLFPNSSLGNPVSSKVVAVEFDTYRNGEWDSSSGDHIGINVESINSVTELPLEGGLKKKVITSVWVSYNASTHTLGVSLYYGDDPASSQGNFNLSHVVDLREVLPEYVAIGFSASTGSWVETHAILSWRFHSTLEIKTIGHVWSLEIFFFMLAALMGLAWIFMWSRKARTGGSDGAELHGGDQYSPVNEEEKGEKQGDCVTADAEPMKETANRRAGKLYFDADVSVIKRGGQEDSTVDVTRFTQMVPGEERDDEVFRMEAVLEEQEWGDGGDHSTAGAGQTTEAGGVGGNKVVNASVDVEPTEKGKEDADLNTISLDATHVVDNMCRVDESAGVSEDRGDTRSKGEGITTDEAVRLEAVHMVDVHNELAESSGHSHGIEDTRGEDICSYAGHAEDGGNRSGRIAETTMVDADAITVTFQTEEKDKGVCLQQVPDRAEDIINTDAEAADPAMDRIAKEDEGICSSFMGMERLECGVVPGEDVNGGAESTDEEGMGSGGELTEREQTASEVLAAMNFLEKWSPEGIPYAALVVATDNFSQERLLGRGGFGAVYRGFLTDWGINVAIKKLSEESIQGIKEYVSEVKIISQLRHRNLVKLIGWCHEHGDFLLVYEFMSNGSLDHHLFDERTHLAWEVRYNIVLGLANALLYLHEECEQYVVHRDVKASNVLLDERFDAKLGDFGLAKRFNHEISILEVTQLAGTRGYMAPEYALMGKASKGSDVYSFGVVVLEIACGLRSVQVTETSSSEQGGTRAMLLVEWVWELYGKGAILEAADRRLAGEFDSQKMERLLVVGLWCAHPDLNQRPLINQARQALLHPDSVRLPDLPPKMPPWAYPLAPGPGEMQQPQVDHQTISRPASKKPSRSLFTRFVQWWRRWKARNPRKITDEEIKMETDEIRTGTALREFSYGDLHRATAGFSVYNVIHESDYWVMYRARLLSGEDVAVKRFLQPHGQGRQWYIGEMMTLSHLSHKNLPRLIGWCHEDDRYLLAVEYTANGSLDRHLFGYRGSGTIPWDVRYKVAIGVASALCYLHDWGLCVLHRDVKPENVMLDEEFNAKLGGFELSRVVDHDDSSLSTSVVAGTMGYMAPEYAITGEYTKESDVYSFGVVALEIACGRRVLNTGTYPEMPHLVTWVEKCYRRGRLEFAVDRKLEGEFNKHEMKRLMVVGLWCTNQKPGFRPQIAKVLRALQFKETPPHRLRGARQGESAEAVSGGSSAS